MRSLIRFLFLVILLSGYLQGQWVQQQTPLPVWTYPISIDAVNENVCWAAATKYPGVDPYLGFIRTTNGGADWICDTILTAEGTFNTICALDANTAYVSVKNTGVAGRIYKTTDGGNNWTLQNAAFTVPDNAPLFIHFFDMNNGVAIGTKQGNYFEIFTTSDAGNYWNKVPDASMPILSPDEEIFCDDLAAAGSSAWFLTSSSRIFRSTDKGLSWTSRNSPQTFSGDNPNLAFKDENIGLLVTAVNSIWRTFNGGLDWVHLTFNEDFSLRYIWYVPGPDGAFMFSSVYGSMYTLDYGNTYTIVDSSAHVNLDFATPTAGWANGLSFSVIFKWAGQPLPVREEFKQINEFSLDQNYPNPFNPVTQIKYSIPEDGNVSLIIYDALGQQTAELVNRFVKAGNHQVTFDASYLSSGVYFYRLKAGEYVETKKLIYIK